MLQQLLTFTFYILFFVTPIFWNPLTSELFEINKMLLVYLLTLIIAFLWLIKTVATKNLELKRTPLDIPILIFLISQVISTVTSTQPHTSIWGYYSRQNGGLLSIFSYIFLYYALISLFDKPQIVRFLKVLVLGGGVVALYAIPEHFGVSPSCILISGKANVSCWVQDVQARVFATLGQPNWLAGYLGMIIFPSIYFFITSKTNIQKLLYLSLIICLYVAFTFTYSRGATIAMLIGLFLFALVFILNSTYQKSLKPLLIILALFFLINLFFGSALTQFQLLSQIQTFSRPSVTTALTSHPSAGTQLENGGTESGKIRLIVWQGALNILVHYPLFGSGVETFAYAYYQFRPASHNLVSEWDFLYNKAHNEFLNYLATTGIVGFISYMLLITSFIWWIVKQNLQPKPSEKTEYLVMALFCSYVFYHIQNFFGFSVVVTALLFFLIPGFCFVLTDATKPIRSDLFRFILDQKFIKLSVAGVIGVGLLYCLVTILNFWNADTYYAVASKNVNAGNYLKAYISTKTATALAPFEPLYQIEHGYNAATLAVSIKDQDASTSAKLHQEATNTTDMVLRSHPHNISFLRTAIRTFYLLSTIDAEYAEIALQTIDQAIALAPTDVKLYYNKALILESLNQPKQAITTLEQVIYLRPNYPEAIFKLGMIYYANGQIKQAIDQMQKVLLLIPEHKESLENIQEWSEK